MTSTLPARDRQPTISCCVLVKDEADLLEGCLRNLSSVADEIIVLDNGSSDDSAERARRFGATVLVETELGQDLARNTYVEAAQGDWILVLDADERLLPTSQAAIRRALPTVPESITALVLPRFDYIGRGRWYHYTGIYRLFRNHPEIRYNEAWAHATVGMAANEGGTVSELYAPIHHYDVLLPGRQAAKRIRYTEGLKEALRADPEDARAAAFLGCEYLVADRFDEAEELLRLSMRLDPDAQPRALTHLVYVYLYRGELDRAQELAETQVPERHAFFFRQLMLRVLAELAVRKGETQQAIAHCEEALRAWPNSPEMHLNLGALLARRDPARAIHHLNLALVLNPNLLDPVIYRAGEEPNGFMYSVTFLSSTRTLFEHLEESHAELGNAYAAKLWRDRYEDTMAAAERGRIRLPDRGGA